MRKSTCFECQATMERTGRNTLYCPECDVCPECGCPDADGFAHYAECPSQNIDDAMMDECDDDGAPDAASDDFQFGRRLLESEC